ncbi:MAG: diguanylate cyclase, partial [Zymomonas sp.]
MGSLRPGSGRHFVKQMRRLPAHLRGELQAEQFAILTTQIPTLYAVLSVNTAILCFSVYNLVSATLSLVFPAAFALLIVVRLAAWVSRRGSRPTAQKISRYLVATTIIAGTVSACLGVWGVALLKAGAGDKPFVPLFIAFGAIACAYCLASLPQAALVTILLSTTPVIAALLTSGVAVEVAAGIDLLLIFLLIVRIVSNQYERLVDGVISHAQVKTLADTDPLTGLANRRAFIEALDATIDHARRSSTPAAVAMIDLDGFKAINDTYGHAAGDEVLVEAARRIRAAVGSSSVLARLGGDEFALLIVSSNHSDLVSGVGATLLGEMSKPFAVAGSQLRLGVSIGFATTAVTDATATSIMSRADQALYDVKHGGGGGVLMFEPGMQLRLRRRMLIEQSLRETDPEPNITVVYQ